MRSVLGFLAQLGLLAIILLALACAGCFDTGAPAAPAPVWQPPPQLVADEKADKEALAAYKQAADGMVKACPAVIARSIDDCADVCWLFNVTTKKEAKERVDRRAEVTLDIMFPERGRDGYKEMVDDLSPLCVQDHLKECGVVEIMQSKALDEQAKAAAKLKLAAQIDPACGAAVAFAERKKQDLEDTLADSRRDLDRAREVDRENEQNELDAERLSPPPYPVNTSCSATPGGGFNCYSY